MSEENLEIARRGYEAFARGDIEGVLEIMDPEVEWVPALAPMLGANRWGVKTRYSGRGRGSGVPASFEAFSLIVVRSGKAVSFRDYETRAEALEAAGLSE